MDVMKNTIQKDITWLKQHERLILGILLLSVALFLGNKWINHQATVAHDKAVIAEQVAKEQTDQNKIVAAQVAQQTALYEQERAERERETQALLAAIATRDTVSAKKVAEVTAPKTAQEAVSDLSMTYTLAAPVTVTETGAEVPTVDIQQFTATKIERDTLQADLTDTKTEVVDAKKNQSDAESLANSLKSQVTGLNLSIKKNDDACTKEKNDLKAQATKSKRNWFIAGFVVGVTTRIGAKALAFASSL